MIFPFVCTNKKCAARVDVDGRIGHPPRNVKCEKCGTECRRIYTATGFVMGQKRATSTFGEEMRARNEAAGHRMKGKKPPARLVAHDYGGGDVREVVS